MKTAKPKAKKEDVFSIRCFLNGKRKLTHALTKTEAKNFRKAALHLSGFLTENYKLPV